MSRYTFHCPKCDSYEERNFSMAEYDTQVNLQVCPVCETKMERVLDIPSGIKLCSNMCKTTRDSGSWDSK